LARVERPTGEMSGTMVPGCRASGWRVGRFVAIALLARAGAHDTTEKAPRSPLPAPRLRRLATASSARGAASHADHVAARAQGLQAQQKASAAAKEPLWTVPMQEVSSRFLKEPLFSDEGQDLMGGSVVQNTPAQAFGAMMPTSPAPIPCHTAVPGEACYVNVVWAMGQGIMEEPLAFPGLTPLSSFRAFQDLLHRQGGAGCSLPCNATRGGPGSGLSASNIKLPSTASTELLVNRDPFKPADNCTVPKEGDQCHNDIAWGMQVGIFKHPEWYKGLRYDSSFEEFQDFLHRNGHSVCRRPCSLKQCLCLFDVDRTLTSEFSAAENCRDSAPVGGVPHMRLSALSQNLPESFCNRCFRGIVAEGDLGGTGSAERFALHKMLGGERWTLSSSWSEPAPQVTSALVLKAKGRSKKESVEAIVHWFAKEKNVTFAGKDVWFFDDDGRNIPAFLDSGFNARQVSCANRDSDELVGQCGATVLETLPNPGVHSCFGPIIRVGVSEEAQQAAEARRPERKMAQPAQGGGFSPWAQAQVT